MDDYMDQLHQLIQVEFPDAVNIPIDKWYDGEMENLIVEVYGSKGLIAACAMYVHGITLEQMLSTVLEQLISDKTLREGSDETTKGSA